MLAVTINEPTSALCRRFRQVTHMVGQEMYINGVAPYDHDTGGGGTPAALASGAWIPVSLSPPAGAIDISPLQSQ